MNPPPESEETGAARPAERTPEGESAPGLVSLENVHGSVAVPPHQAGFWRQWRAFVGPAILISVGYMDPGN